MRVPERGPGAVRVPVPERGPGAARVPVPERGPGAAREQAQTSVLGCTG